MAQGDQLGALWPPRGVRWGGWEGDARGRGYGDICICIADSLCYTAETNAPLWGNCTPIKMLKKIPFKHVYLFICLSLTFFPHKNMGFMKQGLCFVLCCIPVLRKPFGTNRLPQNTYWMNEWIESSLFITYFSSGTVRCWGHISERNRNGFCPHGAYSLRRWIIKLHPCNEMCYGWWVGACIRET